MALKVRRVGEDAYVADVTAPHGDREWHSGDPMSSDALIAALRDLNCHERDIWDALDEAERFGESA